MAVDSINLTIKTNKSLTASIIERREGERAVRQVVIIYINIFKLIPSFKVFLFFFPKGSTENMRIHFLKIKRYKWGIMEIDLDL